MKEVIIIKELTEQQAEVLINGPQDKELIDVINNSAIFYSKELQELFDEFHVLFINDTIYISKKITEYPSHVKEYIIRKFGYVYFFKKSRIKRLFLRFRLGRKYCSYKLLKHLCKTMHDNAITATEYLKDNTYGKEHMIYSTDYKSLVVVNNFLEKRRIK